MQRNSNQSLVPAVANIIDLFLRVGMWRITPKANAVRDESGRLHSAYRYGSINVFVAGELNEFDRGTFMLLNTLERANGFNGLKGDIFDLTAAKGVKNPYDPKSYMPVWDSIESLLNVEIRIKPDKKGRFQEMLAFKLLSGRIDSDGTFWLTSGDYQRYIEQHKYYNMNVPLPQYFKTRSPILRSMREFFRTQDKSKGYDISLLKLCNFIGYAPDLPLYKIRQTIKSALNKLIKEGSIGEGSKIINDRCREMGGIIHVTEPRKQPNKVESIKIPNDDLLLVIQENCPVKLSEEINEHKFRSVLNKLREHFEQNYKSQISFKKFIGDYSFWLNNNPNVIFVTETLFYPANKFLAMFIEDLCEQRYLVKHAKNRK